MKTRLNVKLDLPFQQQEAEGIYIEKVGEGPKSQDWKERHRVMTEKCLYVVESCRCPNGMGS